MGTDIWRGVLRTWLAWRHDIEERFSIPVSHELHAVKFFSGRGRPSTIDDHRVNVDRVLRRKLGDEAFDLIGSFKLDMLTVARRGNAVRPAYSGLISAVESRLVQLDAVGIVIVDGQDEDAAYWSVHRDLHLSSRRIIEDPWMQPSHASQLIQMADFVA